ncbi:MAG: O-antigen ligase family protein [Pseudomonadota bacterium]
MTAVAQSGRMTMRWEQFLFVMLFAGVCSLFTGWAMPGLPLSTFDTIAFLVLPILTAAALMNRKLPNSNGFLLVALFMALNAALAFKLGFGNGVRETIQASLLVLFAGIIALYREQLDWKRMARWFILVAAIVTAYNIYWHVSNGFMVGWKRLNEPKLLFSFAPLAIFALLLMRRKATTGAYALLAGLFILLVLSGERKAQLAFLIHMMILCLVGYTRLWVYVVGAIAAIPLLTAIILADPYLIQQFNSISEMGQETNYTLSEMLDPRSGVTQSNGQRFFALQVSAGLIQEYPIFGIGTNGYEPFVNSFYPDLPPHFLLSIHNEFQRILVENGAVGLAIYLIPWVRSIFMAPAIAKEMGPRALGLYGMFFTVFFLQCFFESSGTTAYLSFIFMALLPELFLSARSVRPRARGYDPSFGLVAKYAARTNPAKSGEVYSRSIAPAASHMVFRSVHNASLPGPAPDRRSS